MALLYLSTQGIVPKKAGRIFLLGLEILLGASLVASPYPSVVTVMAVLMLVLLLVQLRLGVYALVFLVPLTSNYIGFYHEASSILKYDMFQNYIDALPFFVVVFVPTLISLTLSKVAGLRTYQVKDPLNVLPIGLLGWALVLFACSPFKGYASFPLGILAIHILLYYVLVHAIDEEHFHQRLMGCWVVCGFVMALMAAASCHYPINYVYRNDLGGGFSFLVLVVSRIFPRAQGLGHPNDTSLVLNMAICITMGLMISARHWFRRMLCGGVFIFLVFANLLTMSKSGLLGFFVMVHFLLVAVHTLRKHFFRNVLLFNSVCALLFWLGLVYIGETRSPRLMTGGTNIYSATMRLDFWKEGLQNLWDLTMGMGLGPGGFRYYTHTRMPHAHSLYVSALMDMGVIGFVIVLAIIAITVVRSSKMIRFQETYLQKMLLFLLGGFLALGIQESVDLPYNQPMFWFFLGFLSATFHLARQELFRMHLGHSGHDH